MTFRAGYGLNENDPGRVETTGVTDFATALSGLTAELKTLASGSKGFTYYPFAISSIEGMKDEFTLRAPDKVVYYVLEEVGNG